MTVTRRLRTPAGLAFIASFGLIAACGGGDDVPPADDEMEEMIEPAAPTAADFAGTWNMFAMVDGTPDPVPTVLVGSADGMTWTLNLNDREPVPSRASMSGDSLIIETDPYESVIREGVTVQVRTAAVMQGDRLVGKLLATYTTEDGEELVNGTLEGSKGM